MSRCQHCNKLTHSQHIKVYFEIEEFEKITELYELKEWIPAYMYDSSRDEIGKLKCGDMWIHFCVLIKNAEITK